MITGPALSLFELFLERCGSSKALREGFDSLIVALGGRAVRHHLAQVVAGPMDVLSVILRMAIA